jgi:hypothetical protein
MSLTFGQQSNSFNASTSFESVLNEACERLLEKKIRYTITRLLQMETDLAIMEEELDVFEQERAYATS